MTDPHEYSAADAVNAAVDRLRRHPLVWIEDGFFIVRDERAPGFRYDFRCKNAMDALRWAADLAEKKWITTEHIEQFALLAIETFSRGRK